MAPYRMNPKELEELKKQLDGQLRKGFIKLSQSPFGAPFCLLRRKVEKRVCV